MNQENKTVSNVPTMEIEIQGHKVGPTPQPKSVKITSKRGQKEV